MMSGVIEAIGGKSISGWVARVTRDTSTSLYFIRLSGEVLAKCDVMLSERPDLGDKGRGFSLTIPTGLNPEDLAAGSVRLCASPDGAGALRIWRPLHAALLVGALSVPELEVCASIIPGEVKGRLKPLLVPGTSSAVSLDAKPDVGTVSADDAAIVGRDGVLFLYRGSNDVISLYQKAASARISDAWRNLIKVRSASLEVQGRKFLQLFLPEKSSILAELAPYPCSVGSPQYQDAMSAFAGEDSVIDGLQVLRGSLVREASYRKLDSHLSPIGCQVIVQHVLARMGHADTLEVLQTKEQLLMADLAWRFEKTREKGLERLVLASKIAIAGLACEEPLLVSSVDVDSGHVGTQRQWLTPGAPIKARVLCFGNSFLERGNHSTALSWWFSRIFQDFKFVWSADLDHEVISEYSPDIVICQTVERFMARVPGC